MTQIPIPPEEMRALVGETDPSAFDNPSGANAVPEAGDRSFQDVLDFGCGCGRLARRLMLQQPQPRRYLGVDLHAGMIRWCQEHLSPLAPQFSFIHHDVFTAGFNPTASAQMLPIPADDHSFDLIVAHSVFTHLVEEVAVHYLRECGRVLRPGGRLVSTWFLMEKRYFPMMQTFQNALYINVSDPTNAVIFDREWLMLATREAGLAVTAASAPSIRGFAWTLTLEPVASGTASIDLPEDTAPFGKAPPPLVTVAPNLIGT